MRVRPKGAPAHKGECKADPLACKIGHGFTGSSDLLDFLKIVTTVYERCYKELGTADTDPKPYPLIIGFDVPGECGKTIYTEIEKILNNCQNDMGGHLSRKGSTTDIKMEMQKRLVGLGNDYVSVSYTHLTLPTKRIV